MYQIESVMHFRASRTRESLAESEELLILMRRAINKIHTKYLQDGISQSARLPIPTYLQTCHGTKNQINHLLLSSSDVQKVPFAFDIGNQESMTRHKNMTLQS